MKRFFLFLAIVFTFGLSMPPVTLQAASVKKAESIILRLPESVLAETIAAVTPFSFNSSAKMIEGVITVRGIHDLRLSANHLRARLDLAGSNLEVVTDLAGQKIRMKVGEVALAAEVLAELRFDGKRHILYVKPLVDESQNVGGNDVGRGLIALLNGREFPISMDDIEPFIAQVGGKTIAIATQVTDVRALPSMLELSLAPRIEKQGRQ
ncbi:MAG: hypothetical protein LBU39_10850 [Desulfobulbaceae bacterium]|jgi:hypothetical protein|nr:hypothetical protein [Desulfobulbaceae bacterium]